MKNVNHFIRSYWKKEFSCVILERALDWLDAIHRPLGAQTLDGVKRRTRAGMGRCQAGFCSPRVMEILARELDIPQEEICKSGKGSNLIADSKWEG